MYKRIKNLFRIKGYGLLVICMLLIGIGVSITFPYLSLYLTEDVRMSAGYLGLFMAVSQLSGVIVNSFVAKRSDNGMDRKKIILIALVSSAIGYISFLVFDNYFILLFVFTFFSGLGAAAMPQIFAYAQESANSSKTDDKTFALSTLRSLISLGFLVGPLFGTLILALFGYKGLFLGTSGIFLITTTIVFLFLQNRKRENANSTKNSIANTLILKNKQIGLPFLAFIVLFTVHAVNTINTPLFIANELSGTHTDIGLVVGICAGLEIPIMVILGSLGKRISNHSLLIMGSFVAIIYFTIVSVSTESWHLIGAQILQATFVAILMGNGLSYFSDLLPDFPGVSASIYSNASIIGRFIGSLGGGVIAGIVGYRSVNWVCVLIVIISLFILWKTKPHEELEINKEHAESV